MSHPATCPRVSRKPTATAIRVVQEIGTVDDFVILLSLLLPLTCVLGTFSASHPASPHLESSSFPCPGVLFTRTTADVDDFIILSTPLPNLRPEDAAHGLASETPLLCGM
jgi:hypothetical protein